MEIDRSLAYGKRVRIAAVRIIQFHVGDDLRQRWQLRSIKQRTESDIVIVLSPNISTSWTH